MWLNDDAYFNVNQYENAISYCLHFNQNFMGNSFYKLSCSKHLNRLFLNAQRGIKFIDPDPSIINKLKHFNEKKPEFSKLLTMLQLLDELANHKNIELLSSEHFINPISKTSDKVHKFIFENFKNPIQLSDVAAIAKMNPSAFSRFFKKKHNKTYSKYLNEIRIGYASQMLLESNANISTICYDAGYNNISNFNKQFKNVKNMSPSEFIRLNGIKDN